MNDAYILKNVTSKYGDKVVLNIPELKIEDGKITAIVGPNGSGKTTLLNLLTFLEMPSSGEIIFKGEKVEEKNIVSLRRRIGFLPQNPYLFHNTVFSNVEAGLKIRKIPSSERKMLVKNALKKVGLLGYEKRPAYKISGGEGQRVALARTICTNPEVLILDEPSTYMDKKNIIRTEEIIYEFSREKGKTVVFTSQDLHRAQSIADKVLTLFRGELTTASLANLFHGKITNDGKIFDTGRIKIEITSANGDETHISIDPSNIVISSESLISSMRNSFKGKITAIIEENGKVRIEVEAGEKFHAYITKKS
ncbi:MAG: ATP-binding cassette domain-containing protein, partial [Candidatus Schekmanbacteria bacterium]